MNQKESRFDVAVIGGGMVGAAAASLLARSGFSVALVESRKPAAFNADSEVGLRLSAVSQGSACVLDQAGAWKFIENSRCCAYRQMRIEDDEYPDALEFEAMAFGMERLGSIVENNLIQSALWTALESNALVEFFCPDGLAAVEAGTDGVSIRLGGGQRFQASLLIGADGATSEVRKVAGIRQDIWEYNQHGVVAVVEKTQRNPGIAWQRFLPGGPLAFLPLADGRSSIVWSRPAQEARALQALPDDRFAAELDEASHGWLGEVKSIGPRGAFPLTMRLSERYVAERIVLLGDAAHVVHPLAGQGVNLGLADAAALVEVLIENRARGLDLASAPALKRFDRWRRSESELMAAGIHGLRTLFMQDAFAGLRRLGLKLVSRSWSAKEMFLARAAGQGRNSPRLARGDSLKDLLRQKAVG